VRVRVRVRVRVCVYIFDDEATPDLAVKTRLKYTFVAFYRFIE